MKLNRTEWIVVILCVLGLVYTMTRPQPPRPAAKPVAEAAKDPASPAADGTTPAVEPTTTTPAADAPPADAPETLEILKNEAAEYTFTSRGGGLKSIRILPGQYAGETPQVLNEYAPGAIGALSTVEGVVDKSPWTVSAKTERSITYSGTLNGVAITKTWTMSDGDTAKGAGYLWKLDIGMTNAGAAPVAGKFSVYAGGLGLLHANDRSPATASWYADGDAVERHATDFSAGRFLWLLWETRPAREVISENLENLTWAGVHNQYYSVLVSPAGGEKGSVTPIWAKRFPVSFDDPGMKPVKGDGLQLAVGMPAVDLAPQASTSWSGEIYTGPRSGTVLNALGGDRWESMHYGMFRVLSRLFLGILNKFHSWVDSYGIAIILLTLLVRIVIWPLHIKSTRSMKRMSKLSPMMKELKEKYPDDPQRMQAETMKLYRDYGVNPVGGCLPLMLQFPIFLGYFSMMNTAVEMRGHSFLWVKDLSLPDTIFHIPGLDWAFNPLPLVMTVTMYIQMQIAPKPAEVNEQMAMQQKMFKFMPFLFLFFCYGYASALALYWTVQNIISIGQTWLMKRQPEPELVKRAPKPSFMERAMAAKMAADQAKKAAAGPRPPRTGGGRSAFKKDDK